MAEGQLLLRMLHAAGAQLGTWVVGVGSQQPVKTHLKLHVTYLFHLRERRPWGWKVLLSVKQAWPCTGGGFPRKPDSWGSMVPECRGMISWGNQ